MYFLDTVLLQDDILKFVFMTLWHELSITQLIEKDG